MQKFSQALLETSITNAKCIHNISDNIYLKLQQTQFNGVGRGGAHGAKHIHAVFCSFCSEHPPNLDLPIRIKTSKGIFTNSAARWASVKPHPFIVMS